MKDDFAPKNYLKGQKPTRQKDFLKEFGALLFLFGLCYLLAVGLMCL